MPPWPSVSDTSSLGRRPARSSGVRGVNPARGWTTVSSASGSASPMASGPRFARVLGGRIEGSPGGGPARGRTGIASYPREGPVINDEREGLRDPTGTPFPPALRGTLAPRLPLGVPRSTRPRRRRWEAARISSARCPVARCPPGLDQRPDVLVGGADFEGPDADARMLRHQLDR